MTDRRSFLRLSAMAAAAGCTLRTSTSAFAFAASAAMNYGVQLYMMRKQAPSDLAGVLKSIRQIGFTEIELFPIVYSHSPQELKQIVADAGLTSPAAHFEYAGLEDKVDYAHTLGLQFMVCPMVPREQWSSLAGFAQAAETFNRVGEKCRTAGMEFCFHNHCYEFRPMEGSTGFDALMKNSDPKLVKLEFDMYWLAQGGQDPLTMLKKYSDRVRLIHLKDRTAGAATGYDMGPTAAHFTELGKGTIDWPKLIAQAKAQGIRHAFLDQDETSGPVLESMRESFAYLKTVKA
jgi:sugar phosphate isomerase/epimerase